MKSIARETVEFLKDRGYVLLLSIVAAGSYGFLMTHNAIGIDDTEVALYFEDGLAPYVGRWTLFLLNKIISLATFEPWCKEFFSVLVFMISVTVWCVLLKRIAGERIPRWAYGFVAAAFLSCPLISELYTYYLHNGICLAYGLSAIALYLFLEAQQEAAMKRKWCLFTIASFFLTISIGCYESMMVVFLIGALLVFVFLRAFYEVEKPYPVKVGGWMAGGAYVVVLSYILRTIISYVIIGIFNLGHFSTLINVPDLRTFDAGWQDAAEFAMILKRFLVKYYVNALAYFPITILVLALAFLGFYCLYQAIRKRDGWFFLSFLGVLLIPVLMCIVQGYDTKYRTAQYVPLVISLAVFLLLQLVFDGKVKQWARGIVYLALGILLYNQCANMNQWFYLDWQKYEYTKTVLVQVAHDLEASYDTSKPIVFRGANKVPASISEPAILGFDTWQYRFIAKICDAVDPHLKEKFYAENGRGYVFAETPMNSTLQWAITAFDGTGIEVVRFLEMHGYELRVETNLEKIAEAEDIRTRTGMPGYPKDGYILDCGDYIIVNLEGN